ncbi:MAG: DUF6273 domain-containing protein [Clostridiales bacterium]|jgi:hypothetical protein|nr:DUF6273 domain-containing protein [Clostridiales bacterium]
MRKLVALLAMALVVTGCSSGTLPAQLSDLAPRGEDRTPGVVYLKEDKTYQPFLVISESYSNGGALLLRKHLLDDEMAYKPDIDQKGAYYPSSGIDKYLSGAYLKKLSLSGKIPKTEIRVATGIALGEVVRETEPIKRKVFLLSATEHGFKSVINCVEGETLEYFRNGRNQKAECISGIAKDYWLRSAYFWEENQAWFISETGICAGALISTEMAIRPAFCLPGTLKLKMTDKILENQEVFVLE